jgi:hypothetical protein
MQKFLSLGAECLEIQKTADESKGTYLYFHGFFHCSFCLATYDSSLCVVIVSVVSLDNALVCVASLETKLKTTSKALKEADAAKAYADKTIKAAEARAIKA